MKNAWTPTEISAENILDGVVVVVVDVHPGLDAEPGVPHPVVVVGSAGRLQIRGGHHGTRLVNVELRLIPDGEALSLKSCSRKFIWHLQGSAKR